MFDTPVSKDDGPVTVRDPTGKPLVPVLPPPPIDGPDVSLDKKKQAAFEEAETKSRGARLLRCRLGCRVTLGTKGRVHQLLAAHSMTKIERLYGTVFQRILGERISTDPVITINSRRGRPAAVCLHCESSPARRPQAVIRD